MPADVGEKTEPPTARRRTEARNNGQVARSQDLVAAALMLAGFLALYALGPRLWGTLLAVTTTALAPIEGRHEVLLSVPYTQLPYFAACLTRRSFASILWLL